MREQVKWFAERMEETLKRNDHKGGWGEDKCSMNYLLESLYAEVSELENATGLMGSIAKERIINECTDVANFAMMIADRTKQLQEEEGM